MACRGADRPFVVWQQQSRRLCAVTVPTRPSIRSRSRSACRSAGRAPRSCGQALRAVRWSLRLASSRRCRARGSRRRTSPRRRPPRARLARHPLPPPGRRPPQPSQHRPGPSTSTAGRVGLRHHPAEPVAFNVGHVADQAEQGHGRGRHRPASELGPGPSRRISSPSSAGRRAGSQAASPARPPVPCPQRTSGPALGPSTCPSRARRHSAVPGRSRGLCCQSRRTPWHARTARSNAFRLPPTSSAVAGPDRYLPSRTARHARTCHHTCVHADDLPRRRCNVAHFRVRWTMPGSRACPRASALGWVGLSVDTGINPRFACLCARTPALTTAGETAPSQGCPFNRDLHPRSMTPRRSTSPALMARTASWRTPRPRSLMRPERKTTENARRAADRAQIAPPGCGSSRRALRVDRYRTGGC